jgi:uncharacterized iron-regulated membrane protein
MRIFFRRIHLYLGLAAGLVISIICFTGATLVFEKELQSSIYPERYYVPKGTHRVSIDQLTASLRNEVAKAKVSSVKIFEDPSRSVIISYGLSEPHRKSENKSVNKSTKVKEKKNEAPRGPSPQAFMNPYTGELISLYEHRNSFFYTMMSLHRWLLIGETGKLITGIATSIFLFILITGVVLWWPQNKRILQQRLKLKLTQGWKRINHDFHIVMGFYTAIFLFAIAFTGLAWSFQWFNDAIYFVTSSENKRPEPPASIYIRGVNTMDVEKIYTEAKTSEPSAVYYTINFPKDSVGSYSVVLLPQNAIHENATHQLYFDQYTGAKIGQLTFQERNLGQRIRSTFYTIHVGSIGGVPGGIIAFISCIAGFTFPITGTILWISRIRRNKNR